jgi:hypothetical protein
MDLCPEADGRVDQPSNKVHATVTPLEAYVTNLPRIIFGLCRRDRQWRGKSLSVDGALVHRPHHLSYGREQGDAKQLTLQAQPAGAFFTARRGAADPAVRALPRQGHSY